MRRLVLVATFLALALPAAAGAATPRFALWDLQTDLAHASRNGFGDVAVKPLHAVAGKGTVARCAAWCRFGSGWLAFAAKPRLTTADIASARSAYTAKNGWVVRLALRPRAASRWRAFVRNVAEGTKLRGVPDVLVVVACGQIAASPLATQVTSSGGVVTLAGFSRASAKALARQF